VAIGEIGLDYYWDKTNWDVQQEFFEEQLALAVELNLPVSIHDRDAHEKIMATLKKFKAVRGVLHSFSGDAAMAHAAIDLRLHISFAGPITFLNNKKAPALVQEIPLEKILLETDSPYLAPHPLRGKRNEPANVRHVAARLAELKSLDVIEVAAQTTANARALFGFD
jgi:TatD DNase family protein